MVEWVDVEQVAADGAGFLEEVKERTDVVFVECRDGQDYIGYVAVGVGLECGLAGLFVYVSDCFASEVV